MTTVKTVTYIVQWVHMCPTACKRHQTSYHWKQLTSNPNSEMNISWTEITRHENPKLLKLTNIHKNNAQLLQDDWTASANRTGSLHNSFLDSFCMQLWINSFCCFLDGFCTEMYTANNKMQEITKQLDCKHVQKICMSVSNWQQRSRVVQTLLLGQCSQSSTQIQSALWWTSRRYVYSSNRTGQLLKTSCTNSLNDTQALKRAATSLWRYCIAPSVFHLLRQKHLRKTAMIVSVVDSKSQGKFRGVPRVEVLRTLVACWAHRDTLAVALLILGDQHQRCPCLGSLNDRLPHTSHSSCGHSWCHRCHRCHRWRDNVSRIGIAWHSIASAGHCWHRWNCGHWRNTPCSWCHWRELWAWCTWWSISGRDGILHQCFTQRSEAFFDGFYCSILAWLEFFKERFEPFLHCGRCS